MTDLTEQWKKGELPSGWYYTKLWKECNVIDKFIGNQFLRYDDSDIVEVIAPVPSYEEYRNLQHCWVEELEENGQLKEQQETLEDDYNELVCINANLEDNCKTLAQKLLQVKPELRDWLKVNFKEYL